ncbi:molybdate ABC transporter substrate-binding protein [Actinokineospora sp. NPDC004072]
MRRALAALALLTACSTGPDRPVVTVFAAASLTESFTALAAQFEAAHDVEVRLNFAASSTLAQQLRTGATADVIATADEATMARVAPPSPRVFATNRLVIAVPPGNPGRVRGLADLPRVVTVVCAPQVPCGSATAEVLASAGVDLRPASEEQDVKAVLTKVAADEADAGLVYVTDTRTAKVEAIDFPESAAGTNRYPIAALPDAPHPDLARQFVDLVLSPAGRATLADHGFGPP